MTSAEGGEARLQQAACKPGRPKGRCSGGYIEIDAPPEMVWSIIADLDGWSAWNPLYTRMDGEMREGAKIDMIVSIPGMKPMDTTATVFSVRPRECFEYGLSNMGGLLRAFRFVEIEVIAPMRCGVANGETMSGPVGWLLARIAGAKVGQGLRAMNDRLKQLAEEKWRSGGG